MAKRQAEVSATRWHDATKPLWRDTDLVNQLWNGDEKAKSKVWTFLGAVSDGLEKFRLGLTVETVRLHRPTIWRALAITSSPGMPTSRPRPESAPL